jgi:hypothetical protein
MPLKRLGFSYSHVRDLAPLEGMPLTHLRCNNTNVSDFAPLRSLPLRDLLADVDPEKHRNLLADIRTLQDINGTTRPSSSSPRESRPPRRRRSSRRRAGPGRTVEERDRPDRDHRSRPRRGEGGVEEAGREDHQRVRGQLGPPDSLRAAAEYDFKTVFTRVSSECCTAQFLVREGRSFFFEVGGYGNGFSGFALVGGKGSKDNPTRGNVVPRDGVKYTMVVQVRRDRVTALMDDKKISEWVPSMGELSSDDNFCVDSPTSSLSATAIRSPPSKRCRCAKSPARAGSRPRSPRRSTPPSSGPSPPWARRSR